MDFSSTKNEALAAFHEGVAPIVEELSKTNQSHQKKAKLVNDVVSEILSKRIEEAQSMQDKDERQNTVLVQQYASCVASLEYRHAVWPYEYMAFSRRIGELWERFCSTSWDEPSRDNVERIDAPKIESVKSALCAKLPDDEDSHAVFDATWELVGEINMNEDEVFTVEDVPHVVDFKSGFGSNEKGNTLRLISVGRAYKIWNGNTRLMLLVRQMDNNNYLEVLRRSNLWEVYCGDEAYSKIDELTGSNLVDMRSEIIDFEADLSEGFLRDLDGHLSDMRGYLKW